MTTSIDQILATWHELTPPQRLAAFLAVPRDLADDFFLELSSRQQLELLHLLPEGEHRIWLRLLPPDDVADLLQLAPPAKRQTLMDILDEATRREATALMAYKQDAAGGLMNPRFVRLRPEMSVDGAISYLRLQAAHVETIYYAYVLDDDQRLMGVLSLRQLLSADREKTVRDIMRTDIDSVSEEMDQEAVAKLFSIHHFLAMPVVDRENRMKGIVTVDDIVDVVQEEASEDIQKVGGMEALDEPYMQIAFWRMVQKRGGWLAILFVGEMLTATAMGYFEGEIAKAVVLALFVPLIISSGGNSGSQATTLVIRAMAVGEVALSDWWRIIRREFLTGLVLGSMLAVIGFARILIWQSVWNNYGVHYLLIALTVAFSLVGVVLFGTIAGSMLPFILRRANLDPASASAPFVATLVDVSGLVIYFTVASIILKGTLL